MKLACTVALLIVVLSACAAPAAQAPTNLPSRAVELFTPAPTAEPQASQTPVAPIEQPTASPTGRPVISRGNASTLRQVQVLGAQSGNDVAWSPDGKLLAISGGLAVDIYDPATFTLLTSTPTQFRPSGLLFHPDGATLLVIGRELPGQVLESRTGAILEQEYPSSFCGPGEGMGSYFYWESRVLCLPEGLAGFPQSRLTNGAITVAFEPRAALALVGGGYGFRLLQVGAAGQAQTLWDTTGLADEWGTAAAFAPDGRTAALGFRSGKILVITVGTREVLHTSQPGMFIKGLSFHPDGSQLAYVSQAGVGIIDLLGDAAPRELGTQSMGEISSVALSHDGSMLAVSNRAADFSLWDREKLDQVAAWEGVNFDEVYHPRGGCYMAGGVVAFSPDGSILALGDNGRLRLVDVATRAVLHTLDAGQTHAIAFSPDGALVAAGIAAGDYGKPEIKDGIRVWEVASGKLLHTLEGVLDYDDFNDATQNCAVDMAFLDDGRVLASAGANHIHFWDVASGQDVWTDAEPRLEFTQALSTDAGATAFSAVDYGGWFRLWALKDGDLGSEPSAQWRVAANNLALTRDGSAAITLGTAEDKFNYLLRVSETASGALIHSIVIAKTNDQLIGTDLALSGDGSLLTVGFADGRILIFAVEDFSSSSKND